MNKDEKSLLDELWDAAGMNGEKKEEAPAPAPAEEPKIEEPKAEEPKVEEPKKKEKKEKKPKEKKVKEKKEKAPKADAPKPAEKKKDIKFLVLYTTVFVIVISGLIGGSYLITSRIHSQMAENNAEMNSSQSTLKNIQDENAALKAENAALKEKNSALTLSAQEAEDLLLSAADMVEHDGYLAAAQSAYIDGERALAKEVFAAIDREKLSQPNKEFYDLLKDKLD